MSNTLFIRRLVALASLLWLVVISGALQAQTKPTRTDVGGENANSFLWVGNSFFYYNNSMHSHVGNLTRAANPKTGYRAVSVTISGAGIDWHDMEAYFRPNGIGKYSFVGTRLSSTSLGSSLTRSS